MSEAKPKTFKYSINTNIQDFFVDIVIPFRDQCNKVCNLVESLLQKVKTPKIRIILVDDASKNKEFVNFFKPFQNISHLQFKTPIGFGAAVNHGVKKAESSVVCIMHNDVNITEPMFLNNMCKDFFSLQKDNVASICSVTNNPMSEKLSVIKRQSSENAEPFILNNCFSPFICTLVHKQLFEVCGGLMELPLCWYEDHFFGEKIRKIGYKQAVSNKSFVQHEGGVTIKHLINEDPTRKNILKENFLLFKKNFPNSG